MKKSILISQILFVVLSIASCYLAYFQISTWQVKKHQADQVARALQRATQAPEILAQQRTQLDSLQGFVTAFRQKTPTGVALLQAVETSCRAQAVDLLSLPQERELALGAHHYQEVRFSLTGKLQDLLQLSHSWEYHEQLGQLSYFKLAREQFRQGRGRATRLVAQLRFKRYL